MDISHLIYVDDILMFTRATKSATKSIMECLQHFQQVSGLKVNKDKCEILISKRASLPTKQWIYSYTGFSSLNLPFKYLAIHLIRGRTELIQFDEVIDKIISTLQGWFNSYLSNGGRITLLKSMLTITLLNVLQVATMKRSTHLLLERIFNRFLWAGNRKQVAWAGWQKVAKPWEAGDLGFKGLHQMQHISLCKLWIKFRQNEYLWAKFMQAKYCKFDHPGEVTRKVGDSRIWIQMLKVREDIEKLLRWELGQGEINFWKDNWCPTDYLEPLQDEKEGDLLFKDYWNGNVWSEDIFRSILKDQSVSSISTIQFDRNNKDQLNLKNKTRASISKDIQNNLYSWDTCQWNVSSCQKNLTPSMLFFSWRALNNLLPTDDILKLKGLKGPSRCHLYCIKDWQEINLMPIPFIVAWFIWMSRNMAKHEEREANTTRVMINCLSYLNKLISWRKFPKILQTIMVANNIKIIKVRWERPSYTFIKINTDGSYTNKRAGIGGIFRDHIGHTLLFYKAPYIAEDALDTEAAALYWALKFAMKNKWKWIVAEVDSSLLVELLNIKMTSPWEANRPANFLAMEGANVEHAENDMFLMSCLIDDMDNKFDHKVYFVGRKSDYDADYDEALVKFMKGGHTFEFRTCPRLTLFEGLRSMDEDISFDSDDDEEEED
ncbi:uncharacterized protein LOC110027626 [Phalaenopsis equestris]|uniref:uncharacterized protein LOC110027626 n=1 Tax=Phalaenopsis equestris TaxID=78828 RepID=UPI0009E5C7A6|nr:uncharacterized protein LOC110027626 [Phalaenopsis equestris]